MRTTDEELKRRETADVVKLTIEGARNPVNTIREQQTGSGMSLLCPFPALEVNVPVTLGKAGEMRRGSIHRIRVEDDPETGLPRLRLSIRTEQERETVLVAASPALVQKAAIEATKDDLSLPTHQDRDPRPRAIVECVEVIPDEDEYFFSGDSEPEPPWTDAAHFSMPDELKARSTTRRRHHIASAMVWTAILSMLAGGAVAMERAGIVDVRKIRQVISGFSVDTPRVQLKSQIPAAEALASMQLAEMESARPGPMPQPAEDEEEMAPQAASGVAENEVEVRLASAEETDAPEMVAGEQAVGTVESEQPTAEPVKTETPASELSLMLPTRWPAEYATAYRVREPNGVVVDVPGGLVKREGWLEMAGQYPMVRSIKAVQRETGARFIVYTQGEELPRFVTEPQKSGVKLRLIWSETEDAEQLAAL